MSDGEAKIKLHWLNGSRSQGTLWLLEELEIPYELEIYHRQKTMLAPPELAKIHPLGHSPVLTVTPPGGAEPIVLAESAFIVQYLCDHFPNKLVPKRWKDGQEGKIGGETEEWLRYQYIMYYSEGTFMAWMVQYFVFSLLKGGQVPFFLRPITRLIANQVISMGIFPNLKKNFGMLEKYLETSPGGGRYLCGQHLTGADIMLAYALISGSHDNMFDQAGSYDKGTFQATYPKLHAYARSLEEEPGWKRSVQKIVDIEGSYKLMP